MKEYIYAIIKSDVDADELSKIKASSNAVAGYKNILVYENRADVDRLCVHRVEYELISANTDKPWEYAAGLNEHERKEFEAAVIKTKDWYQYHAPVFEVDLWDMAFKQLIVRGYEPTDEKIREILEKRMPHVSEIANKVYVKITEEIISQINDYEKEQSDKEQWYGMEDDRDEY